MQTAQDFMQSYLREQEEVSRIQRQCRFVFEQKYYTDDFVERFKKFQTQRENNPESFVSAEVAETSAKVITVELIGKQQRQWRYHLRPAGTSWQIYKKDWQCFSCHGSGKWGEGDCKLCSGSGWMDIRTSADRA